MDLSTIIDKIPDIIVAATVIVTAAGTLAAMTDTKSDDKIVNAIKKVLNIVALNIGKAKNADDK